MRKSIRECIVKDDTTQVRGGVISDKGREY